MKGFLQKVLLFAFVVLLVMGMAEAYVRSLPNPSKAKHDWMGQHSTTVTTLVLGNSHTFYGIRPALLADSAFSLITCALHTSDGVTPEMEAIMQKDLGSEAYSAVYEEAKDAADSEPVTDPVELTAEYLAIRFELEEKIDEALEHERGYYDYCKEYWMAKRMILRSDYGIRWKSPIVLNPNEEFH